LIIVHASDLHFGRRHDPKAAEAFARYLAQAEYDLLVLSGDFTQRAKVREYEEARAFLDALPDRPTVVTPGNHDIPLYRVFERAFNPTRNYQAYIAEDLNSVTVLETATVVALDSTAPHRTIVNGRVSAPQVEYALRAFQGAPSHHARILVLHHALAPAPGWERDSVMQSTGPLTRDLVEMGVELVLAGHLHRAFVASTADVGAAVPVEPAAWIVHSGTTTSVRGRGRERGRCTFNTIEVREEHLEVRPHMYDSERSVFAAVRELRLPRRGWRFEG